MIFIDWIVHSFATENECEFYENIFENKDFCKVVMSSEDIKTLEFN